MRLLILTLAVLTWSSFAKADPPPIPPTWVPVTNVMNCSVDTEDERGYCRVFMDTITRFNYLVFFDEPGQIKFIRTATAPGEYQYIYQRPQGQLL